MNDESSIFVEIGFLRRHVKIAEYLLENSVIKSFHSILHEGIYNAKKFVVLMVVVIICDKLIKVSL